ncbi:MAG: Hpt domain-containing protein [Treponema sp.]|jgi:HPt (histidine-containing phosphotransfer) domain-containing protein|nr:Hpt domain-containing protein [Treponema sp.]
MRKNGSDTFDSFIKEIVKIEEINTEIGLGRFQDKKDTYRITMDMFQKKLPAECDKMAGFLADTDTENFAIAVHTMKSSLATIGAMRLCETAFELETASKKGEIDFCRLKFPDFKEKLLSLYKKLSVIFSGGEPREKKPGDMSRLKENAQKALAAVEAFDSDSGIEILKDLSSYDFGAKTNILLENALNALENFEYEGASESLSKIK